MTSLEGTAVGKEGAARSSCDRWRPIRRTRRSSAEVVDVERLSDAICASCVFSEFLYPFGQTRLCRAFRPSQQTKAAFRAPFVPSSEESFKLRRRTLASSPSLATATRLGPFLSLCRCWGLANSRVLRSYRARRALRLTMPDAEKVLRASLLKSD